MLENLVLKFESCAARDAERALPLAQCACGTAKIASATAAGARAGAGASAPHATELPSVRHVD